MRRPLTTALFAAALLSPLPAFAGDPNCPPGSWFCSDVTVDTPPVQTDTDVDPPEVPDVEEPETPAVAPEEPANVDPQPQHTRRPRVVVVQQTPPSRYATPPDVVIVAPGQARVVRRGPPPAMRRGPTPQMPVCTSCGPRFFNKWSFGLRLEGAAFGDGSHPDAGMGGLGISLKYRPVPAFAFDISADVLFGKDYNGFDRMETPFSANAMIYVNPRSRAQFYLMAGAHMSHASVTAEANAARNTTGAKLETEYSYIGGQAGIGMEFRIGRRVGLNFDALGFLRKRTDENADRTWEFVNPETGQKTNTSAGLLFRGGLNFWW